MLIPTVVFLGTTGTRYGVREGGGPLGDMQYAVKLTQFSDVFSLPHAKL